MLPGQGSCTCLCTAAIMGIGKDGGHKRKEREKEGFPHLCFLPGADSTV